MPLMDDGVGAAKASQAPHHPTHQDNKNQNNQQYSHHTPPSHSREKVGDSQYITTSSLMASGTKHALKVPTTWATPIIITEEALIERFPGGWREEVYSGVVVRHYSPFSHPRGATLIFTFFSKSGSVKEVWEKYEQREDGLVSCHRPTSRHHRGDLCQHQEGHTQTSRVIGETTWREEYDERPDLLLARTVTFGNSDPTPPRSIQRIEEEFGCPDNMEPHKVVQRRVFQVSESKILLVYHYGRHRLLQPTRSFLKPQNGRSTALTPDMTQGFQPDPSVEGPAMPQLWAVLEAEMEAELRVQEEVRRGVEETAALRTARANEEHHIVLLPHMFDIQRNETVQYILKQRKFKEKHREEAHRKRQEEREDRVDTISPYLPLLLDDSERDIGEMVRERCLQDLRERLALRANLLQDRLDQARAVVLECREEAGRRKRLTAEERAALTTRTTTAEAAHRRLRAQLAAWRHEASERYETLAVQLENDLRLNQPGSARRTSTNTTTSNTHTS
ncbi:dynein regulatory complex subunit 7-like isoform X2 [Homarus americanus]|nr:dynein regulatory complex subunit 7-like isoform X2 [Homarus americanus]